MDELMAVAIVAIIFGVVYKLFELYVRRKERIMLIEKMGQTGLPDLSNMNVLPQYSETGNGALRLGCLLIGLGLGLLCGFFIVKGSFSGYLFEDTFPWGARKSIDVIYSSCVLLGGGIGLLIAYLIEVNNRNKKRNEQQ